MLDATTVRRMRQGELFQPSSCTVRYSEVKRTFRSSMKRAREAAEAVAAQPPEDAAAAPAASPPSDSDGDALARPRKAAATACPFLDTVNRSVLDFDFEKCCSVTLSPLHCYACLVCGKYFQGRGPATTAYTHALEAGHHVFMKLSDGRVYCLPDGYEVLDRSLDDIRHVLDPRFSADALTTLDTSRAWSSALDGTEYLPGVVGLNNIKATDYVNVVLQALMRVKPLRDLLLRRCHATGSATRDSPVLQHFGELTRKVWNPRNFKGQVRCICQASG
jgi:U4/U6.U5 tri-snRNP-associated protein 2